MADRMRLIAALSSLEVARAYLGNLCGCGVDTNIRIAAHFMRVTQLNLEAGGVEAAGSMANRIEEITDSTYESIYSGKPVVTAALVASLGNFIPTLKGIIAEQEVHE